MSDRELLENILAKISSMDDKISSMDGRISSMENIIQEIKEDTEITRSSVNSLIEWADNVGVITQVQFPIKKAE